MNLVEETLRGSRLALARLLTLVENDEPQGQAALSELFTHTGQAHLIGVTGAPGTGKSSLVNRLAYYYRHPPDGAVPRRVGIVAVDPTSPFSGGAILGDRVRMRDLAGDPGVFIRSMASRGSLGGLARATSGVVQVFDAAGFEIILIETVGAGQTEVDIARLAHTTLVIETPGLGDDIQAIKAGILEIADILVLNKADRPGADAAERALRSMLSLAPALGRELAQRSEQGHHARIAAPSIEEDRAPQEAVLSPWIPPILRTVATEGQGIADLAQAIASHAHFLNQGGGWQRREQERLLAELELALRETLLARWRATVSDATYQGVIHSLARREISPLQALSILLDGGSI